MRTFNLAATLVHESFEGYRDLTELLEMWTETDSAGIATLSLEFDGYANGGQRQHVRFTINNTSGGTATVQLNSVDLRYGYYIPGHAPTSATSQIRFRYRASSGLAGATASARAVNSIIPGSTGGVITADGQWHEFTNTMEVFADSIFAAGLRFELSGIPAAASGTIDFDDFRIVRVDQIEHAIDTSVQTVASMRPDWADGFRETIGFPTHVVQARDGTEHRTLLRVMPRLRLQYTAVAGNPVDAAFLDAWLWANQDTRVAVPRWQDALLFESIEQANTWIWVTGGSTDDRWFWPQQRILLWRGPDDYETVQTWQIGTDFIRLDVNVNTVQGTWDATTRVVPLLPGRLAREVAIQRPNGRTGIYPLAFDLDMVAATVD